MSAPGHSMRVLSLSLSLSLAAALLAPAHSADLDLPRDGWASWQVPAVENALAWCCWSSWDDLDQSRMTCQLDGEPHGYGSRDHTTTDAMKVYARFKGGRLERLQAVAASCPVETKTPVQDLGNVAVDDSARWLIGQVKRGGPEGGRRSFAEGALGALAMHRGELARDALVDFARSDTHAETRKNAVFWLAQTGAAGAETVIVAALEKDTDGGVREHAVFALSQLPDDRAARALIDAAEDPSLSRELRKRAVFWLSQSESAAALAYLETVLARAAGR